MRQIVVGSWGSTLALTQARWVVARLKEEWPSTEFKLATIKARGEREHLEPRACVAELEEALNDGRIHIAVQTLKDMPVVQPSGLEIAAIPRRIEARDALVGRSNMKTLAQLPQGVVIGTSNLRCEAFLRAFRPDITTLRIHDDVELQLEALGSGEFDALVLAAAGLIRLDLRNRIDEMIDTEILLPTPGQGAIALEVRSDNDMASELAYGLHHHHSDDRISAERAFLGELGDPDPAQTAIAALALVSDDGTLSLEGAIAAPDGSKIIRASVEGDAEEAEDLGRELAEDILAHGGRELLQQP